MKIGVEKVVVDEHLQQRLDADGGERSVLHRDHLRRRLRRRVRRLRRRVNARHVPANLELGPLLVPLGGFLRRYALGLHLGPQRSLYRGVDARGVRVVHQERADGHAVLERLDEDLLGGQTSDGHRERHVAPQRKRLFKLLQVGSLQGEVNLLEHVHAELLHGVLELKRLQRLHVPRRPRDPREDGKVPSQRLDHARVSNLHRDVPTLVVDVVGLSPRGFVFVADVAGSKPASVAFEPFPSVVPPYGLGR